MESLRFVLPLLVILPAIVFLPSTVAKSDAMEAGITLGNVVDRLLQGLNSCRQSEKLPPLAKNEKAACLAHELAEQLEDQPCPKAIGSQPKFTNYSDLVDRCGIDINTAKEGFILPVCVPEHVETLVLTNYTQTPNAKYINDSRFTGVGIGTEDDWMVVILTTDTPGGSAAALVHMVGFGLGLSYCLGSLLLGLFLVLVN